MVPLVLGLCAVVLVLVILRIAEGTGKAAVAAHVLWCLLSGVVIVALLAVCAVGMYLLLSAPHSPPLI